jgi:predicted O-methyltransferase YrrM
MMIYVIDCNDMPESGRKDGLRMVLDMLHRMKNGKVNIVETGTIRNESSPEDGWSTLVFGWYCNKYGGRVFTIDKEEKHIEIAKRVTRDYKHCIEYIVGRGDESLKELDVEIDLLYLDSAHGHNAAVEEYEEAKSKLAYAALIMVDDADSKGIKLIPKLEAEGWEVIASINTPFQQRILIRKSEFEALWK